MKLNVTAVVVGSVALIVLGGIGISGLLHANGIIPAFPSSFSWIGTIGTPGCAAMVVGAGLGVLAIGLGARNIHLARMAAKAKAAGLDDDGDDEVGPKLTLNLQEQKTTDPLLATLRKYFYWIDLRTESGIFTVFAKNGEGKVLYQVFPKGTTETAIRGFMRSQTTYDFDTAFKYPGDSD